MNSIFSGLRLPRVFRARSPQYLPQKTTGIAGPQFGQGRIYECREAGHCGHMTDIFPAGMRGIIIQEGSPIGEAGWSLNGQNNWFTPADGFRRTHIGNAKFDLLSEGRG